MSFRRLILVCTLPWQLALASDLRVDTLKQVDVKGIKVPGKLNGLNPVQTLSATELARTNSLTVADAVKHLSGVQLRDYGGIGGLKTINVRSLGSLHTAVLYDGVQLGNAQNGQIDLSKFSLDNVETLELYNGQSNSLLQPARSFASASVLSLTSRRPVFNENEKDHGKLSFKGGSFGLINPAFLWQHKLNSNLSSSVSAEMITASGKYPFRYTNGLLDTMLTRENSDVKSLRAEASIYAIFADSSSLHFKVFNYQSERGLPAVVTSFNPVSAQRYFDHDFFVQSFYRNQLSKRYTLELNAKYSYNYNKYKDPYYAVEGGMNNYYNQNELYFSSANTYHLSDHLHFGLSADITRSSMTANLLDFPSPVRTVGLIALSSLYERGPVDIQGSLLTTVTHETVKRGEVPSDKQVLSPSVSLALAPFKDRNLKFIAFYKNIFRMPTFNDLYFTYIGNADLNPEYTNQYNFGLQYSGSHDGGIKYWYLQANAYYNDVKDRILATPKGGIFWSMENIGKVEVEGLEASVKTGIALSPSLTAAVSLNYTYQNVIDRTENFYGNQLPYSPNHSGSSTISLYNQRYGFNYNFIYSGEYYTLRPNIKVNLSQPWYTHDMGVFYSGKAYKQKFKVTAEVNNLFNQWYQIVSGYPMPGRSLRLSLNFFY